MVTDIVKLDDNVEGKKSHFKLYIKGGEEIRLKCDDLTVKDKWVASLRGLMEIFRDVKMFDWEDSRQSVKDTIDMEALAIIMDEQEGSITLVQMSTKMRSKNL